MRLKQDKLVSFNEFLHEYTLTDGRPLVGVTTLLKKHGLAPDYGGISPDVLQKAAERGTAIHKMLEDYDNGIPVVEDENLRAYRSLALPVHCSEYLVSDDELVASFVDKVLEDCSLVDVKTTSTIHAKYVSWQLSIYAYLFERMNRSKKVPHLYCAHVREGRAKLVEMARIPDEQVEALLQAERDGVVYQAPAPDADSLLERRDMDILVDSLTKVAAYKAAIKAEEERAKAIQDLLYEKMLEKGLTELPCAAGKFSLKAESTRTGIDAERLKREFPEIAEKFTKVTPVKGCVVFKSNNR